jgi:hypothetical protein
MLDMLCDRSSFCCRKASAAVAGASTRLLPETRPNFSPIAEKNDEDVEADGGGDCFLSESFACAWEVAASAASC